MFKRHCENCDTKMDCILVDSGITIYWCGECGTVLQEDKYGDDWNKPELTKWNLIKLITYERSNNIKLKNIRLKDGEIVKNVEFWAFPAVFIDENKKEIKLSGVEKFLGVKYEECKKEKIDIRDLTKEDLTKEDLRE